MTITANKVKKQGVSVFDKMLEKDSEIIPIDILSHDEVY